MSKIFIEDDVLSKLNKKYASFEEKDINEQLFNECMDIALSFSKRQLQYALFKINWLSEDVNTGMVPLDATLNFFVSCANAVSGKDVKYRFFSYILEKALEEKS